MRGRFMSRRSHPARTTPDGSISSLTSFKRALPAGDAKPIAHVKIALPSRLSPKCGESVYNLVLERLKTGKVRLLLDASGIRVIDQEGLRWLYEISALMKRKGMPKVVIREPNRLIRDAMILSNIIGCFEIMEREDG